MLKIPFVTKDKKVDRNFSVIEAWARNRDSMRSLAAPTDGEHLATEIYWNEAPTAGGYIGWVCIEAGTPGTWKGFGSIEP